MKSIFQVTAVGLIVLLTNCQKEPVASIGTNKHTFYVGEKIYFYDNSKDGRHREWNFGDGTTSSEKDPVKVYDKTGSYTIRLTSYSKNKRKEDDDSESITVGPAHFEGTHRIEGSRSSTECKNGTISNIYSSADYNLVIKKGSTDDEIIIDNLGDLGINGVRCKVTSTHSSFFFFETVEYDFTIVAGQVLTDRDGNTWSYGSGDVSGEYDNTSECRSISVHLNRTVLCSGSQMELEFSENIHDCN